MSTKEEFAKHGVDLEWGRSKVVLYVGKEKHKIVCSPESFRWLKRLIENTTWIDPELEAERAKAEDRRLRALRRRESEPQYAYAPQPQPPAELDEYLWAPAWKPPSDDGREFPYAQPDYDE
jgi:hypothetical protein